MLAIISILAILGGLAGSAALAKTLKEKEEDAIENYKQEKEEYLKEADSYKDVRQDFLKAKDDYRQTKNAENKNELEDKTKGLLGQSVLAMINRLEALRSKAESARGISESERMDILAEIDKDINWLKNRQNKLAAGSLAQVAEEANAIKDYWGSIRLNIKKVIGDILAERMNYIIDRAESYSGQISSKIQALRASGKDTAKAEALLNEFNRQISLAKEKQAAGNAKFQAISDAGDADALFKEGRKLINDANIYIRQAHATLIQIAKEMKRQGKALEALDSI